MQALIDSGSEVNAVHPAYAAKLGLTFRKTNVGSQKIDGSPLETIGRVIAGFQIQDKLGRVRFFQKTFFLADTSMEVVLGMPFLTLSTAEIRFAERELVWRTYTAAGALSTTRRVEIIDKELAAAALNEDDETFVVHVAVIMRSTKMTVHPSCEAQIASLNVEEVTVPPEYSDYVDVFSKDSVAEPPENTGINDYAIDQEKGKQLSYGPIYSLGPVELETLKTYIETNLASGFIRPSKSPTGAPILFVQKPDESLRLCVNY